MVSNFQNKKFSRNLVSNLFAIIIICLLGLLIYSNTFHSPFQFDDEPSIVENQALRNLGDLQAIWDFNPPRFITYFSFALNYHFNQLRVPGYHLTNLIIHLISAILVWWLVLLTFSTPAMKDKEIARQANLLAFFSGLLFVAHPIQTQAVTYIVQRTTSLAALFYLASLSLYVKARLEASKGASSVGGKLYYGLSLMAAVLGMFTKQIVFTLPLMLGLYEFCFLRSKKNLNWKIILPFLALLPIIPLIMVRDGAVNLDEIERLTWETEAISRGHYLLTQFRVLTTYLRLLFIPLNQNLDYDYPLSRTLWEISTLASFSLLLLILSAGILLFRRYRLISFTVFWFFLTLSVESSLIPIRDVIFEHRLYLPLVSYSLFLPVTIYYLCRNKKLRITILITIVSFYSVLAYTRNEVWKSEFALWDDTVRKSPGKYRPYLGRARAYINLGLFEQAISDSNRALIINPHSAIAYLNRGVAYENIGEYDRAASDYAQALRINPNFARAYGNIGNIYRRRGEYDQAISNYTRALSLNPGYAEAYNNRGITYLKIGEHNKAISDFSQALRIRPRHGDTYNNRGVAYLKIGEHNKAIFDFSQVLKIKPGAGETYSHRAIAYFLKGEYDKAWEDIGQAQRLGYRVNPAFLENISRISGKKE